MFLLSDQILLFHLLPLHPPDRIHLILQCHGGTVDFLLHCLEFPNRERSRSGGLQIAFSHSGDSLKQRIELKHKLFQPEMVECQGKQVNHSGNNEDHPADYFDQQLIIIHIDLTQHCPGGRCQCH